VVVRPDAEEVEADGMATEGEGAEEEQIGEEEVITAKPPVPDNYANRNETHNFHGFANAGARDVWGDLKQRVLTLFGGMLSDTYCNERGGAGETTTVRMFEERGLPA
jgi:hypothetical protein